MKKLKVALVGCGSIAEYAHFPAYAKITDLAEVVACADIVPEKAKHCAEKYGVAHWYSSVEELLANEPDIDYVDVCTWTAAHAPVVIAAAKAGKDVLCEKPLAASLEQGLEMQKVVKETGIKFMLAVCTRYGNEQKKFIELRDAGTFGDIYLAKCAYIRRRGVPGGWFTNKAIAGGGPTLDIGVHAIDRTWYLMGRPTPVTVSAETSSRIGRYKTKATYDWNGGEEEDTVFDVEDSATAYIRFEGGKAMIAETSWTINGKEVNNAVIYGTKAGCTFDPLTVYGEDAGHTLTETTYKLRSCDIYEEEIRHFIDCFHNGETPISSIDDSVTILRILDGIYRSAEAHREVEI